MNEKIRGFELGIMALGYLTLGILHKCSLSLTDNAVGALDAGVRCGPVAFCDVDIGVIGADFGYKHVFINHKI